MTESEVRELYKWLGPQGWKLDPSLFIYCVECFAGKGQLQRVLEASPDCETAYAHMAHELEHTIDQIIIRLARLHRSMLIAHETEEHIGRNAS